MPLFRPFQGCRPTAQTAAQVAALPYDVMNREEAKTQAKGNPRSFLHVDRAEIDLPDAMNPYDPEVYRKAAENLDQLIQTGVLVREQSPCFYIYQQEFQGRVQTGVVGCAAVDDYLENRIKKHELTREEKEQDRIRHVDACNANTGPIFLTYREDAAIRSQMEFWCREREPLFSFVSDGVRQTVWAVADPSALEAFQSAFARIDAFYIADGHHRCASAVKVGQMRRAAHPGYTGQEEFNFFLAVAFPDQDLKILDYNRVVKDLNGNTPGAFLKKIGASFTVEQQAGAFRPVEKHSFGMVLEGNWYALRAKPGIIPKGDPVRQLDVSILQDALLHPILGIQDPRTDPRIDFVGGIRGLEELERRVAGGLKVAFSMAPPTLEELMAIADAGRQMPPKSTWFEPKLLSGLFIHPLCP